MTERFKRVSEWVAQAGDTYITQNENSGLTMGVIDQFLRKQGLSADAVSLEIAKKNIKLVILIPDELDHPIEIISGNKQGDVYSSFQESMKNLSEQRFLEILRAEFS